MQYLSLFHNTTLLSFFDQLPIAIFVADPQGNVIWNNKRSAEGLGISRQEIKGKNIEELEKKKIFYPSITRLALEKGTQVTRVQEIKEDLRHFMIGTPILNKDGEIEIVISLSQTLEYMDENKDRIEDMKELLQSYIKQLREMDSIKQNEMIRKSIMGTSKSVDELKYFVKRVANLSATVLLTGETGVGKSHMAEIIHETSNRKDKPFFTLNCGTIPENLLESELFGYIKGAFTGASKSGKTGLVEAAEGGTLFLDEIGETSYNMQVKLLELLQEKTFLPIGSTKKKKADIRIIAATNQPLEEQVEEKKFRSDLYYRLNVFSITVPPLRERKEDIPSLAYIFLQKFNKQYNMQKQLSNEVFDLLSQYSWPGNIRELENVMERAVVFSSGNTLKPEHFPSITSSVVHSAEQHYFQKQSNETLNEFLERVEKAIIMQAVDKHTNTRETAKNLGISQPTLIRRLQKYRD